MLTAEVSFIVMLVVGIIGLIICSIGMYKCEKALRRNNKVFKFKNMLAEMAHDYNMRHVKELKLEDVGAVWEWFANKWSYDELLHSSKPLTLEEWFTEEEIARINA